MPRPRKNKKEETEDTITSLNVCDRFFSESGAHFEDKFGNEVVSSAVEESTGLSYLEVPDLGLQWALGRKGFALGRIMYVVGFEGASKTSLSLWIANLAYASGGFAAMIETEQAGSAEQMQSYLEFPEKFRVFHPDTIEDAMSMSIAVLNMYAKLDPEGKIPKVLIMDSIAGSTDSRTTEDEDTLQNAKVGGTAKLIKDATNLIKIKLRQTNTLWVVLNQGRDLINTEGGMMGRVPEIDKIVATGGRALPFAATYYLILKKNAAIKDSTGKSGFKVKATFKKNKLRSPYKEVFYHVKFGETLDFVEETINLLTLSKTLGIKKTKKGYSSVQLGISEEEAMTEEELYEFAHSPENIKMFQEALDIITDDVALKYNPDEVPTKKKRKVKEDAINVTDDGLKEAQSELVSSALQSDEDIE